MHLLLISASARTMAESAERTGYSFLAIDRFGDWDLSQTCDDGATPSRNFCLIRDFEELFESCAWRDCDAAIIGGGVENRIELVQRLEREIHVLGPSSENLARLQTIGVLRELNQMIAQAGGQVAETSLVIPLQSNPRDWLKKKLGSAGGMHVGVAQEEDLFLRTNEIDSKTYFQRRISGAQISAVFAAVHMPKGDFQTELIGVTRQLVGEKFSGGLPFAYCGSIGPISVDLASREAIQRIGHAFADEFGVTGIFGIDLILNHEGVWPVDFNPRIPASAEIFELAGLCSPATVRFSVVRAQVALAQGIVLPEVAPSETSQMIGKSILFCQQPAGMVFDERQFQQAIKYYRPEIGVPNQSKWISDIPQPGTKILYREPVMSLYVTGATEPQILRQLQQFAADMT